MSFRIDNACRFTGPAQFGGALCASSHSQALAPGAWGLRSLEGATEGEGAAGGRLGLRPGSSCPSRPGSGLIFATAL